MQTLTNPLSINQSHDKDLLTQKETLKASIKNHWTTIVFALGLISLPLSYTLGFSILAISTSYLVYKKAKQIMSPIDLEIEYKEFLKELEEDWR